MIPRIGVLTSGGDAPGMNAAIRAVVREKVRDMGQATAAEIAEQLAILVEKFLAAELQDSYAEIAGEAYVRIDYPGRA